MDRQVSAAAPAAQPAWSVWRRVAGPLALFLLALAPRLLRAWQLPTLSPDGVFYLETAQALAAGNWSTAFHELHLNTFPLILAALHRLGLSWETAAVGWNVLAASLAVCPLYGWMRRQATPRLALLGALLYAGHGEFIEQSPEAIREPTFWLFAAISLYASARAAAEKKWRWAFLALASVVLAAFTRVEGALFIIPCIAWNWSGPLPFLRGKLLRRWLAGAAALVLVWLALNAVWAAQHNTLEGVRTTPLRIALRYLTQGAESVGVPCAGSWRDDALPELPHRLTLFARLRVLATTFRAGLTPVFAVLLACGVCLRRREVFARAMWPLWFLALGVTAGMWMHLWYDEESSSRYVLTVALVALPAAAHGAEALALALAAGSRRMLARFRESSSEPSVGAALLTLTAGILVVGWVDALWNGPDPLASRRALAHWVGATYGPEATVLGTVDVSRLVGYYAPSCSITLAKNTTSQELLQLVQQRRPAVVLIQRARLAEAVYAPLVAQRREWGFEEIDAGHVAPGYAGLLVLARPPRGARAKAAADTTKAVATFPSSGR